MRKFTGRACPECKRFFRKVDAWCSHVSTRHPNLIPEGFTVKQYLYGLETGKMKSTCMYCNSPTRWNENTGKYSRLCGDRDCQEIYSKKHGTSSPDQQRLMGRNRGDTREYNYQGQIRFAQGINEMKFLVFMDTVLHWPAEDILNSNHTYWYHYANINDPKHDGRLNAYLPDYYIPSLNLEVEIKDQTNHRPQFEMIDRIKEAQKDAMMKTMKSVNYYKLNDNDFDGFIAHIKRLSLQISDHEMKEGKKQINRAVKSDIHSNVGATEAYSNLYGRNPEDIVVERSKIDDVSQIMNDTGIIIIHYQDSIEELDDIYQEWLSQPLNARNDSDAISYNIFGIDNLNHFYYLRKMLANANSEEYSNPFDNGEGSDTTIASESVTNITESECFNYNALNFWQLSYIKTKKLYAEDRYDNSEVYSMNVSQEGVVESICHNFVISPLRGTNYWLYSSTPKTPGTENPIYISHDTESIFNHISSSIAKLLSAQEGYSPNVPVHFELTNGDRTIDMSEIRVVENPIYRIDDIMDIDMAIEQYCKIGDEWLDASRLAALESHVDAPHPNLQLSILNIPWLSSLLHIHNFTGCGLRANASSKSIVEVKNGIIYIRKIMSYVLFTRMSKTFGTNHIKNIFLAHYNPYSWKKYLKKRITKSQLKIDYISSPEFFAIELVEIFRILGEKYNDSNYIAIANKIYGSTWLAAADRNANGNVDANGNSICPTDYSLDLKIKPLPYQFEFVRNYTRLKSKINMKGCILCYEQGLGKTLVSILVGEYYKFDHIYIVCPNSLIENWALEIKSYFSKYEDNSLWNRDVVNCKKANPNKVKNGKYFIINNESISSIYPFVKSGKNMLIVDESHNFRSITNKRTKELIELQKQLNTEDTLLVSGTPIKALPSEIAPALSLLDPLFTPDVAEMYVKIFNSRNIEICDLANRRFGYIMYRKTKDEVMDLPPKITEDLTFKLSNSEDYLFNNLRNEIFRLYNTIYQEKLIENKELMREMITMVKQYSTATIENTTLYCKWLTTINTERSMRLHDSEKDIIEDFIQAYVYPNIHSDVILKKLKQLESKFVYMKQSALSTAMGQILPPARKNLYIDLFDEGADLISDMICGNEAKTIIFTQFKSVADYIHQGLNENEIKALKITGDVKNRSDIVSAFRNDDTIRVLVCTSQTMGTGFTLTEANQIFFFGPPWRDADFNQCCDRVHRIGQTLDVHIYIVTLDSGSELNVSTRMSEILTWSRDMFNTMIVDSNTNELADILEEDS